MICCTSCVSAVIRCVVSDIFFITPYVRCIVAIILAISSACFCISAMRFF